MTDDHNAPESHDTDSGLGELQLTTTEARILGCLVEKEATTPDQYPLTQNAILTASNQKTSRDPVMNLEAGQIGHALRQLETRGVKTVFGSRADRFEHRVSERYSLTRDQQAVLTLLMLRGPQTAGELLGRSERLHRFDGADAVHHALNRLAQREPSLIIRIRAVPASARIAMRTASAAERTSAQCRSPAANRRRHAVPPRYRRAGAAGR
ncbi:MAG: YceH family protein [Lysobacteraceae bacterium]